MLPNPHWVHSTAENEGQDPREKGWSLCFPLFLSYVDPVMDFGQLATEIVMA